MPRNEVKVRRNFRKLQKNKKGEKSGKKDKDKKLPLSDMSVDDFMKSIGDSSDGDSEQEIDTGVNLQNGYTKPESKRNLDIEDGSSDDEDDEEGEEDVDDGDEDGDNEDELEEEEDDAEDDDNDYQDVTGDANESDESNDEENAGKKHKMDLEKLKDTDPEFYKYLEENDKKLLQFNLSDSSESDNDEGGSDTEDIHQPPSKLEVNSDESDYEDDDGTPKSRHVVTLKMVKAWREKLQNDKSIHAVSDVVHAFHAALQRVAPEPEQSGGKFKVDGGSVFNAVVQMCVMDLYPAVSSILKLPPGASRVELHKCKRWGKLKGLMKSYMVDLLNLISSVASTNISTVLLKHIHQMCYFVVPFSNVMKNFLKKMISLWGTGEETVRVVAFMCILKVSSQQRNLLDQTLRIMYMTYIQNTKFVSPSSLPGINFMRRSLAEMLLLDENVSYHHAFLYIRQLAIHLRNALTVQRKESVQAVYNWQYMASLSLWVELLSGAKKQVLQPLLFPVVQVLIGTLKLIPTAQYYPLRFHCVNLLIKISQHTATFIPILPFLLEVLTSYDFNKKHTKASMKPLDFTCILRVSKAQQQENGFKDAVMESIYTLLLQYLAAESQSIAFPDLTIPAIIQFKSFLKKCKIPNYTKKIRQILEKVEENSKFILNERNSVSFDLSNRNAVETWETSVRMKGTPLASFLVRWSNFNNAKQVRQNTDQIDVTDNFPKIIKPKKKSKPAHEGPVELLPSDDSDSDVNFGDEGSDEEEQKVVTKKRGKRGGKSAKKLKKSVSKIDDSSNDVNASDVVEDINMSDW